MKPIEEMIRVNREQARFYDAIQAAEADTGHGGYAKNEKANLLTRAWAGLRYRQQAAVKEAGVEQRVKEAHVRWAKLKEGGDFLEIGCFSGSRFTFDLVALSGSYLGVDLSPKAVQALNQKLADQGLAHKANAEAVDLLVMDSCRKFDLLYAYGVLHHFKDPVPLFDKLASLMRPGSLLVFTEPSAIHPLYHAIRSIYRPFQSDASWEWPFTPKTVAALEARFQVVEGFGWGSWSLPLSVLTGLPWLGRLARSAYRARVRSEVEHGWGPGVWSNSFVTAVYRLPPGKNGS